MYVSSIRQNNIQRNASSFVIVSIPRGGRRERDNVFGSAKAHPTLK